MKGAMSEPMKTYFMIAVSFSVGFLGAYLGFPSKVKIVQDNSYISKNVITSHTYKMIRLNKDAVIKNIELGLEKCDDDEDAVFATFCMKRNEENNALVFNSIFH